MLLQVFIRLIRSSLCEDISLMRWLFVLKFLRMQSLDTT